MNVFDGTKKRRGVFFIVAAALLYILAGTLIACEMTADESYTYDNLNSPFQFAAYNDGYIYYNPDGTQIIKQDAADGSGAEVIFDIAAQKDGNIKIEGVTGLTVYNDTLYFLYYVPDIYKYNQRIGKIKCDGTAITLDIVGEACEKKSIYVSSSFGYLRVANDKIFISGDGYYSPGSIFSIDGITGVNSSFPVMYTCFDNEYIYAQSCGRIIMFSLNAAIGDETQKNNLYLTDTMQKQNESGIITPQAMTISDDGVLYMTIDNVNINFAGPYAIYSLNTKTDTDPRVLFEHDAEIYNLVCHNSDLYFSDRKSVYKYNFDQSTKEYICEYTVPGVNINGFQSFTILGGRLYPNLNDFSVSYQLE